MNRSKPKTAVWCGVYLLFAATYVVTSCRQPIDWLHADATKMSSILYKYTPEGGIGRDDVAALDIEMKAVMLNIKIVSDMHRVSRIVATSLIVFLSLTILIMVMRERSVSRGAPD